MSWIIAGSILGWLGVATAFGLFDTNNGSTPDDDEGLGEGEGEGEGEGGNDVAGTIGDDELTGTAGTVLGFAGEDFITVTDGTAFAGDDNDEVVMFDGSVGLGEAGDDLISVNAGGGAGYGGDGDDRLQADSASFSETTDAPGPAAIFGDAGTDSLVANGDALAYGGTGDDYLYGENSATLYGDENDDVLLARDFANGATLDTDMSLYGGQGYDTLSATAGDSLYGDEGKDVLVAGAGDATLTGGAGADNFVLQAWQLSDGQTITVTDFSEGDDLALLTNATVAANTVNSYQVVAETIAGSAGFTVVGTQPEGGEALRMRIELQGLTDTDAIDFDIVPVGQEDIFNGLSNNSVLSFANLAEVVNADAALFGSGTDTLFGAGGDDTLTGASSGANDVLYGGDGDDLLRLGAEVYGGRGDDTLTDSGEAYGDDGNDTMRGSQIYGGTGADQLTVLGSGGETRTSGFGDGGDGNDTLSGFDASTSSGIGATLLGGAGDDLLISDSNSFVTAGAGNDIVAIYATDPNLSDQSGEIALGRGSDLLAFAPSYTDLAPIGGPLDTYQPDVVSDFNIRLDQLAIVIPQAEFTSLTVTITSDVAAGHTDVALLLPTPPDVAGGQVGTALQSFRLAGVTALDPADILLFADVAAVQAGTSYGTLASG